MKTINWIKRIEKRLTDLAFQIDLTAMMASSFERFGGDIYEGLSEELMGLIDDDLRLRLVKKDLELILEGETV